jgi:hypothetical protein
MPRPPWPNRAIHRAAVHPDLAALEFLVWTWRRGGARGGICTKLLDGTVEDVGESTLDPIGSRCL